MRDCELKNCRSMWQDGDAAEGVKSLDTHVKDDVHAFRLNSCLVLGLVWFLPDRVLKVGIFGAPMIGSQKCPKLMPMGPRCTHC